MEDSLTKEIMNCKTIEEYYNVLINSEEYKFNTFVMVFNPDTTSVVSARVKTDIDKIIRYLCKFKNKSIHNFE